MAGAFIFGVAGATQDQLPGQASCSPPPASSSPAFRESGPAAGLEATCRLRSTCCSPGRVDRAKRKPDDEAATKMQGRGSGGVGRGGLCSARLRAPPPPRRRPGRAARLSCGNLRRKYAAPNYSTSAEERRCFMTWVRCHCAGLTVQAGAAAWGAAGGPPGTCQAHCCSPTPPASRHLQHYLGFDKAPKHGAFDRGGGFTAPRL